MRCFLFFIVCIIVVLFDLISSSFVSEIAAAASLVSGKHA